MTDVAYGHRVIGKEAAARERKLAERPALIVYGKKVTGFDTVDEFFEAREENIKAAENAPATTGAATADLEPWTLTMEPAEYVKRYPKGPNAKLARQHVKAAKGGSTDGDPVVVPFPTGAGEVSFANEDAKAVAEKLGVGPETLTTHGGSGQDGAYTVQDVLAVANGGHPIDPVKAGVSDPPSMGPSADPAQASNTVLANDPHSAEKLIKMGLSGMKKALAENPALNVRFFNAELGRPDKRKEAFELMLRAEYEKKNPSAEFVRKVETELDRFE